MREIDLGFGVAGWLLVILLIYTIIKNHRSIYEFIRNTIIYKWLKDPKNTEIIAKFASTSIINFFSWNNFLRYHNYIATLIKNEKFYSSSGRRSYH